MSTNGKIEHYSKERIKILIVEDQKIIRQLLEDAISQKGEYEIVASIENASMAELYCIGEQVDMILMDVYTAQRESGLEAAKKIKKYHPDTKIIIITSMPEQSFIKKAKEGGCDSFWYKEEGIDTLMNIIERTMSGEKVYPKETPVVQIGLAKSSEFTERELEVLRELVNGYSRQEICDHLGIAKTTLQYHINNILLKSGYDTKVKLIIDVIEKKFMIAGF